MQLMPAGHEFSQEQEIAQLATNRDIPIVINFESVLQSLLNVRTANFYQPFAQRVWDFYF
jgi:hypothetical protein